MSDLKEYLKVVLTHLNLVKLLSPRPTPQCIKEIQDIDWLIEETQERILKEEESERDCE